MIKNLLFLFAILLASSSIFAQNPLIDDQFRDQGSLRIPVGTANCHILDLAVQKDGKIVMAGFLRQQIRHHAFDEPFGHNYSVRYAEKAVVLRMLPDGNRDSTFGNHGILVLPPINLISKLEKVAVDTLGYIYASGKNENRYELIRITPAGNFDDTFSPNFNLLPLLDEVTNLLISHTNQVILCGNYDHDPLMIRFKADGNTDTKFGRSGVVTTLFSLQPADATDFEIQQDSLILTCGIINGEGYLIRYLPNGDIDMSFGNQVYRTFYIPPRARLAGMHVYSDNHIVLAGETDSAYYLTAVLPHGIVDTTTYQKGITQHIFPSKHPIKDLVANDSREVYVLSTLVNSPTQSALFSKFNAAGEPDSTFGFRGQVELKIENQETAGTSCAWHPSGHFLWGGKAAYYGVASKLSPTGALDSVFNSRGYQLTAIADGGGTIWDVAIDSSQNLVYVGTQFTQKPSNRRSEEAGLIGKSDLNSSHDTLYHYNTGLTHSLLHIIPSQDSGYLITGFKRVGFLFDEYDMILLKRKADGSPDQSFGQQGITGLNLPRISMMTGKKVIELPNGKILVAGDFGISAGGIKHIGCARFMPNGTLDTSFLQYGYTYMAHENREIELKDMIVQDDGKILISGIQKNRSRFNVMRFLETGEVDLTFGTNGSRELLVYEDQNSRPSGVKIAYLPNGKIVIGVSGNDKHYFFQLKSDGNMDQSFNGWGSNSIKDLRYVLEARDLARASNGDLLLAGHAQDYGIAISCVTKDGTTKSSFGTDGLFIMEIPGTNTHIFDIEVEPNGNFYLAGSTNGEALIMHFLNDLTLSAFDEIPSNNLAAPLLYPNPISSSTTLQFELSYSQDMEINLLDLSGKKIACLAQGHRPAGSQKENLSMPAQVSMGWYIVQLKTEEGNAFIKANIR